VVFLLYFFFDMCKYTSDIKNTILYVSHNSKTNTHEKYYPEVVFVVLLGI